MRRTILSLVICLICATSSAAEYFTIEVVDEATGRGVPLVELKTTSEITYHTDSNGIVAFNEPGLMNEKVWFAVSSHGYELAAGPFGYRGVTLQTTPGTSATIKIRRINVAERLYRITGQGIYRDSVLVGRDVPIEHPVLNALVTGQDSVQTAIYRGKIYWFWGDTNRVAFPLGHFKMSGAVSDLPSQGGLDPSRGINLRYFVDAEGFSRPMAPLPEHGLVWIDGLMVLPDESGRERLLAYYSLRESLEKELERGLVLYDDEKEIFERFQIIPDEVPLSPRGHPFPVNVNGTNYFYFPAPYPAVRVQARWDHLIDMSTYEAFTPLVAGARYDKENPALERDGDGRVVFSWKKNTPSLGSRELAELIEDEHVRAEDCPFHLVDADSGKPILLHGGSVNFNAFRNKYIMIGLEVLGSSVLGEVWYAEAPTPEGPWRRATKIVTHDRMDFYNPKHHPFLDQEGGRFIYFEGTYVNTFSGNPIPTPRYNYNQVMYRLDLADPRLQIEP